MSVLGTHCFIRIGSWILYAHQRSSVTFPISMVLWFCRIVATCRAFIVLLPEDRVSTLSCRDVQLYRSDLCYLNSSLFLELMLNTHCKKKVCTARHFVPIHTYTPKAILVCVFGQNGVQHTLLFLGCIRISLRHA